MILNTDLFDSINNRASLVALVDLKPIAFPFTVYQIYQLEGRSFVSVAYMSAGSPKTGAEALIRQFLFSTLFSTANTAKATHALERGAGGS
jgi:hypothetical protein